MKKAFLAGAGTGDQRIDDDLGNVRLSVSLLAEIVEDIQAADIIHAVTWQALLPLDKKLLQDRIVLVHLPDDVMDMLMHPEYLQVAPFVDHWIVPTTRAMTHADRLGIPAWLIPFGVHTDVYYPLNRKRILRDKYHLPREKYLIGNFQDDTEGTYPATPFHVRGSDIFLEIVKKVNESQANIHVVLAGSGKHWLKQNLEENGIPHTYIVTDPGGRDGGEDHSLTHEVINELYNLIDLYIASSRLDGGPKAILECVATKTKIISSDDGQSRDVLGDDQIYRDFLEASTMVEKDIRHHSLDTGIEKNYRHCQVRTFEGRHSSFARLYASLRNERKPSGLFKPVRKRRATYFEQIMTWGKWDKSLTIFFEFHRGPWGGGNQFLLALSREFKRKKYLVRNSLDSVARGFLFNSFHIDFKKMKKFRGTRKVMIHRIDGPTYLVRGKDKELDDNIFSINTQIADVSVFQSAWSLLETVRLGYRPVNPVVIHNAPDSRIFNRGGKLDFSKGRKTKLISTSWSDNPRKGGAIYQWLDRNLDWSKYQYTFVGRVSERLDNIRVIDPIPSRELAALIKQHDIYLTASDNDPCSNALVEALACGLPAVYFNRGGHPELVGSGGVGFENKEDIPGALENIVENYQRYCNLVRVRDIGETVIKYEDCLNVASS